MKIKIRDYTERREVGFHKDEILVVLAIEHTSNDSYFRVWSNKQANSIMLPMDECIVVDDKLSTHWRFYYDYEYKTFDIMPEKWNRMGFWEDFYDQEEPAVKIFLEEAYSMLIEEGQDPNEVINYDWNKIIITL